MAKDSNITVKMTPPDLLQRLSKYPRETDAVMKKTAEASLLTLQESVSPYPPARPNQKYVRTGTLGRSLGVGMQGSVVGTPSIKTVKKVGTGFYEGTFGSNLEYAADVIGEGTQKPIFKGRWWTIKTVALRATAKIIRHYEDASRQLARFIDGKS